MKNFIAKAMSVMAILLGVTVFATTSASADDGVLYGKAAQIHKIKKVVKRYVKRHYKTDRMRNCTYYGHGSYRCERVERRGYRHNIAHRHRVVRRHHRAKHVADVAVVKAAYVRRPGGKWHRVKARVAVAKVYARKRR